MDNNRVCYNVAMRGFERSIHETKELSNEKEHFDDIDMARMALAGLGRVTNRSMGVEAVVTEEDGDISEEWEKSYWGEEDRTEEKEREEQFELLTVPEEILKEYGLPNDLPPGICIMGGTARSIARRVVAGDYEPVRDLDLTYIEDLADSGDPLNASALDELSAKYMPDDYAYGHGIQQEKLGEYFANRDLTVNQCLVAGDKLLMTRAAYDDLQENILRLSFYEQPTSMGECSDRMLLKMLLLQTVLKETTKSYPTLEEVFIDDEYGDPVKLVDQEEERNDSEEAETIWSSEWEEDDDQEEYSLGAFDKALALNKAMDRGVRTAIDFTKTLAEWNFVDEEYAGRPMALARHLNDELDNPFTFRPNDEKSHDEHNYNSLEQIYPGVAGYEAHDKAVRDEIKSYSSRRINTNSLDEDIIEPQDGCYTIDDYKWMNIAQNRDDEY